MTDRPEVPVIVGQCPRSRLLSSKDIKNLSTFDALILDFCRNLALILTRN